MNKYPKISVVVPVYNVEKYLEKCVDSIINQTYKNLEIILVDDGSTDNSGKICDQYAKKDTRIKVIHKSNGGLSDARNAGINQITGDYIGFIDSDDYIEKDMYEYLYELIYIYNADISVCKYIQVKENEKIEIVDYKDINDVQLTNEQAIKEVLNQKLVQDYAWNKLYKKELFEEVQYPKGKKMEDLGTTYKLFYKANKVVLGNKIKYFYITRQGSILSNGGSQLFLDKFKLAKERYEFLKEKFPNMVENDIEIINKILELYRKKDKQIDQYIEKNNIKELYNNVLNNNKSKIFKYSGIKMKLKILLFSMSENLYKMI